MAAPDWTVDFPTLGDLADAWIAAHCRIPDRVDRGRPFVLSDKQFWWVANHYRIRSDAGYDPEAPPRNQAFFYRRSLIVDPQKSGKGPWAAAVTCFEAVGPSQFAGWANGGEMYSCSDNGCSCGFVYEYEAGEPMGERHPSPLIQLTATSQEQVGNVYRPLIAMIHLGPLRELLAVRGSFVRILGRGNDPNLDRIDAVTSSGKSRLGNPISFAVQDETGFYTDSNGMREIAETQRRGAAGMGGRTLETTNAWDPAVNSVAQTTFASTATDIFKFFDQVPPKPDGTPLSYRNKRERRKIHEYVYRGSPWVDLDSIEAEASELLEHDPAQAERFFGNRIVAGLGAWMRDGLWKSRQVARVMVIVDRRLELALGFDGSESDDWTGIRLSTLDGHRFTPTYGPDRLPTYWDPSQWGGTIPRHEVDAAVDELCSRYRILRAYCDPHGWETQIDNWALEHGEDVFVPWATYRIVQVHAALERVVADLVSGWTTHDDCAQTEAHYANARKLARPGQRYILGKPTNHQKIDLAMADVLASEAAADARTAAKPKPALTHVRGSATTR